MACPTCWINCCCWIKEGSARFLPLVQPLLYLYTPIKLEMNYLEIQSEKWYQMKLNWNVWAMADTTTRSRTKCRRIAMAKRRTSYWPMYRRMSIQWCCGLLFSIAGELYIPSKHPRHCVSLIIQSAILTKMFRWQKFDKLSCTFFLVVKFRPTSNYPVVDRRRRPGGLQFNCVIRDRKSASHW